MIARTEDGGKIKIAMYAFSDERVQDALIEAAFNRNIRVKVILDGVADWTYSMRNSFAEKVKSAINAAPKNRVSHFQLKDIPKASFRSRDRTKFLKSGEEIFGTMHEKFGVFYTPGSKIPFHAFAGSSNLSPGSDRSFSENRFVFQNEPAVARQFAEEFARLWNEYGVDMIGNAESEPYIPADPAVGGIRVIFNGEPIDEERNRSIDEALLELLDKVRYRDGSVDVMMFSFTHFGLAQKLIEVARRYPKIKIRILLDQSQLIPDEDHRGILGPWIEEESGKLKLNNIEVRYKWRSNVFGWEDPIEQPDTQQKGGERQTIDPEIDGVPQSGSDAKASIEIHGKTAVAKPIHWRSLIMHHKVMIVNRELCAAGSFNWSSSAERRNFENLLIFNRSYPGQQHVVDAVAAEFEALWAAIAPKPPFNCKFEGAQVLSGPEGRERAALIVKALRHPEARPVMEMIDKSSEALSAEEIASGVKSTVAKVERSLDQLVAVGLLYRQGNGRSSRFGLSD